ncbi:hypothetical protein [Deinococcus soli (ex Cha et al. 2016)]|uniref:Uncharacterized protein n=2 Tax=Deinococcus soli (ex Cha et al. 2016) TaxID=1309411 RepID=A0AAE3XC95_9DEIO|nr:hypothetical protein [Deinococcus soli (ex Cha et al. 2016)]MDR6218847.1 hypothetical protein [Deinococcus soli (ex Cha et al. 2016)]MDR6328644.1 hypothetical protein [Deinococcus soli (ex Cha et al. 2016)]MDR6751869.1 hypothetical protein [Deinococcus soli (ex Cha et al. 2016)]
MEESIFVGPFRISKPSHLTEFEARIAEKLGQQFTQLPQEEKSRVFADLERDLKHPVLHQNAVQYLAQFGLSPEDIGERARIIYRAAVMTLA